MNKILTFLTWLNLSLLNIYAQSITVTSPNGGETLPACQASTISWTGVATSGFYNVEYSINNGANWSSIASNFGGTSFSWNPVSNIQSTQVKIRVSDANNLSVQDQSDNFFTITAAIILTVPNGGEVWQANTTQNITWTSNIVPTTTPMTLQYSTNGGGNWTTITTSAQAGAQSYAWLIPGGTVPSIFCLIRIFETAGGALGCKNDQSNNPFEITAATPIITVNAPNTATTLAACQTFNITWTYQYPPANSAVKLEYTTDNGVTWNLITGSTTATSFLWTIPATPSNACKVKVTSLANPSIFDVSNVNFTIVNPTITVTSPNTALTYYQYQTPNITWSSTNLSGASTLNIELSLDGGITWSTLIANTPNDGSQAWPIGIQTPSTSARIRISTTCNNSFSDINDVNFTIAIPAITVTAPNTTTSFCVGSSTTITWTATNLPAANNVKIEYSIDNGSTWVVILATTPNDGNQAWIIPNTPSGQCLVRITDPLYPSNFDISNVVFTILTPLTNVTSPNGGEVLIGCTTYTISFAKCGTIGNTKLEYSLDNGVNWIQIATNITTLTYAWTVPNVSSNQCLIRATDLTSLVTDLSDAVFIINPSLQITTPNGGENFQVGGPVQTISWISNGTFTTTLRLDYSINNGATWTNIATGISNATTSYNWTIPNTPSAQCLVRVYEGTTATPPACKVDQSNTLFTISPANSIITVTSPNTNVTWYTGATTNNITWTYPFYPANNVKIEYSTDNGSIWSTIFASTLNDGNQLWSPIPNTPSPNCLVRISDVNNPLISDVSNVNFQIVNPTLTLTSLNGGNNLIGCNTVPITWTNVGVANTIKIEASYDGGLTWNLVTASTANSGTYNWTIPNNVNSSNCLIKLSDASVAYITDQSNAPFSIANNSQVTLYSPNGGEVWTANSIETISWVASGIAGNMTIQYSTNNGTTWTTVSTTVPNTGSYSWTVPNVASALCMIKIFETATPCKVDQSNAVFTIAAQVPVITVTSPNTAVSWIVGSTNAITWSITNGTIANVRLEYSTNNGSTWTQIIASTPAASGTYNWIVPPSPSIFCLVRISNVLNPALNDISNVNFTIYNAATVQAITLTNPNGGDILNGCSGTSINWNANNSTSVARLISATGTLGAPAGTGPWTVTITGMASTTGLNVGASIFATSGVGNLGAGGTNTITSVINGNSITYSSTGGAPPIAGAVTNISTTTISTTGTIGSITGTGPWNATITMAQTAGLTAGNTFTATNGTGNLGAGGTYTITNVVSGTSITYSSVGGSAPVAGTISNIKATNTSYKLDYSADNGTTWSPIVALTAQPSNGACSYLWSPVVGSVNSTNALVKVTNATNLTHVDQSDGTNTISQPIVLIQPNFGGAYVAGSTMNISWIANGVSGFYNISYSTDGGTNWNTITFNQNILTNSYQWVVPATATGQLKIRVEETGNPCKSDDSDVNSSIMLTPQVVTVTAPNGSETWATCSSQNITWTSTNASGTYNLQYSTNGGTTWVTIASNVVAGTNGSYAWTVPNSVSGVCLIRVSNGANVDQSNAAFSITQSVPLTVTTNTAICSGSSLSLLATGATSYSWSPATGLSSTSIANPTAAPPTTTTYTVTGTLNGCTNSKLVTVTVNPIPIVSINQNNVPLCSGITLQANGANSYSWTPNIGLSNAAIANPVASPISSTLYTVTGSLNGCTATANVTVNPNPTVVANASASTICSGTASNLTASGATSYTWSPAVGLSSGTIANPIASPVTTQTYTVTGISNGCSSTATVTVTVNAAPVLTVGSGGSICAGSSYPLSASGAVSYSWSPATGLSSANISSPIATPSSTTTYTLTGSNGTCTDVKTVTVAVIPIPVITIAGSQTICVGSSTVLTASGGSNYVWSPATGLNNPLLSNPTASPAATTNYVITSTVNGCQGTANFTLNVFPSALINSVGSTNVCQGNSVVLNANVGAGLTYQWQNNGTNILGATGANYTATSTGLYTVTINSSSCPGSVTSASTQVTVNPNLTPTFAPINAICSGASLQALPTTSTNNIIGSWSPVLDNTTTTNYTFTPNAGQCALNGTMTITVNSNPASNITLGGANTFCQGDSVVLNANVGAGLTYQWQNNGTNIIGATGASYTAASSGSYAVIVSNVNGCSQTSTVAPVTVNALPNNAITLIGSPTFCFGDSVVLNASVGNGLTYQWQNNGTNIVGATGASYTVASSGSYSAIVTNTNGCSQTSTVAPITVNPLPNNAITLIGSPTFCFGDSVVLNASVGNGLTYQWQNNGTNIVGATGASYTATSSGSYAVLVSNVNGCSSASSAAIVSVNSLPNVTLGAFNQVCDTFGLLQLIGGSPAGGNYSGNSVNGNNFNTSIGVGIYPITYSFTDINGCSASETENLQVINCPTAGINEQVSSGIYVYPNPSFGYLIINVSTNNIGSSYILEDSWGHVLKSGKFESLKENWDISNLASGVYQIKLNESSEVIKLIKN